MLTALVMAVWAVFIYNLLALAGSLFLGKFLFSTNIVFLRVLMDPAGATRSVAKGAGKIVTFAGRTAISGAILYLVYFL